MAVIQKIRERYAKLAGGVIGLSLIAFIVSEGVNGSFSGFFGNDTSVAKVNGDPIDSREFTEMSRDYISLSEIFRKGQPMTDQEQAQIRSQVLDQMVNEKIIEEECEKLGIVVSPAEQKDMISGPQPDQTVQQFFSTIFGVEQFDPRMVKEFEQQVKTTDEPKLQELGQQWEALKKLIVRGKLMQKYNALIAGSVYTPKAIQGEYAKLTNTQAGIRFVKLPLTLVPDTEAPVTDADMKEYMNRHKAEYQADQPSRTIEYVVYDVLPDATDTSKALGVLQTLRDQFATASDNEIFVNRNSEERYTKSYVNKARYMSPMADTILGAPVGSVHGPFFDAGAYKLVKVIERKSMPDSVSAKHILIGIASQQNPQGTTDTIAHQRADSIYNAILAGANFDSLAVKYSDDQGSKVKGGDLGYFGYGMMVPEFNETAFMGATGDLKVVRTQFGWHVIRITDQKAFAPAVQLATITKSLNIGAKADQAQFAKANEFAGRNRDAAAFDAAVKKESLSKRVAEDIKAGDYIIQGLGSSRDIIRWAYAAKLGEVSDPIHLENKYVVAKVAAINEAGLKSLDAATKAQVEGLVRAEKKAKILADKYKTPQSLEALAQQSGQQVMTVDSVSGTASFTDGIGFEPKVIGYAFNPKFQTGTISPAIRGKDGVFYISVLQRNVLPTPLDPQALRTQAAMQDMQTKNYVQQAITQALRRQNKISVNAQNIF